jgi:hypothetical protein
LEQIPDGQNHPFYEAMTQGKLVDFKSGIEAFARECGFLKSKRCLEDGENPVAKLAKLGIAEKSAGNSVDQPFTELDFKYGCLYSGTYGNPPKLGPDWDSKKVCSDGMFTDEYRHLATEAASWIAEMVKRVMPGNVQLQSRSCGEHEKAYHKLIYQTYWLQEYVPNGRNHALYIAVTQETFANFKRLFLEYKERVFATMPYIA